MTGVHVVLITAPDPATAEKIARTLVEERIAACVNVVPDVKSIYRWRGEVEEAPEVLLIVKTRTTLFEALAERVRALHPYEVPEIIALPVDLGSAAYLDWVLDSTDAGSSDQSA